jgi:heavy metal sensor kinase
MRGRLTLWHSAVLAVLLIAFAVASHALLNRTLMRRVDHFAGEALSAFSAELAVEVYESGTAMGAVTAALSDIRFRDLRIVVLDSTGEFIATGSHDEDGAPTLDTQLLSDSVRNHPMRARPTFTIGEGDNGYRVHVIQDSALALRVRVAAAYPLRDIRTTMAAVGRAFAVAVPIGVALAALGGLFLARRSLAPVAAMGAQAAAITATTLHERLPVTSPNDELGRLATIVNGLLDRLERAFTQQRRFMADASHELRTPVAILRTESQVTLARPHRSEAEYRESAVVMADVAQRLSRIVDDLFLLARADAGHLTPQLEHVDLEDIVHSVTRSVQALAEQHGVQVHITNLEDAPFNGDRDLLGRILLNLLDNAIKHSPPGSSVDVALVREGADYVLTVSDAGPGIKPEDRERIFERFVRLDSARTRPNHSATTGAGLGLAIARWAAEAHGGSLYVAESAATRTTFELRLPAPKAAPPAYAGLA